VKAVDNPTPYEVTMQGISSDRIAVSYHGIAHTHLDSLAHINENGVFYNGYTPAPMSSSSKDIRRTRFTTSRTALSPAAS
jgi:hypothetical protein